MSSIFDLTPIYITIEEIKSTTSNTQLQSENDSVIKSLIYRAQRHIDDFLVKYWSKFDDTQEFIFPIDNDWVSYIPKDIKESAFYIVEYLYIESKKDTSMYWDNIKSISEWDTSITFDTDKDILWAKELTLALNTLMKYKRNNFKITA